MRERVREREREREEEVDAHKCVWNANEEKPIVYMSRSALLTKCYTILENHDLQFPSVSATHYKASSTF